MSLFQGLGVLYNVYLPNDDNSNKITSLGPVNTLPNFTLTINIIRHSEKDVFLFGEIIGDYVANIPTGGNADLLATNCILENKTTLKKFQIVNLIKIMKLFNKYKCDIKSL